MTIHVNRWSMTSDSTAESADRLAGTWAKSWRLSWLPDRLLTHEQALAGMDLAEIFSTQDFRHDPTVRARALICAGQLGIPLELIGLELLHRRHP
ncbi:hypothetical protein OG874_13925 [Nocardia sp. NBC_00565]|uniref:hypothetical protein n=1 Tax=Nocardia sp. NBC_00565 TaxID=2975993 RepID=UPI002E81BBEA|nr:hypothetical protein [Nocardia sp. NBC_00565]WUC06164.1 hypothetical protein OG874_13925 [Nocardia sp. NBC_00565]